MLISSMQANEVTVLVFLNPFVGEVAVFAKLFQTSVGRSENVPYWLLSTERVPHTYNQLGLL